MSVESKLERLSLDLRTSGLSPSSTKSKVQLVADSWEDDDSDTEVSRTDTRSPTSDESVPLEAPGPTHLKSPTTRAVDAERELNGNMKSIPHPPPPTPISPSLMDSKVEWAGSRALGTVPPDARPNPVTGGYATSNPRYPTNGTAGDRDKRPEKTTATANRLIAGALGIKAPAKTKEQREYDRAVKEAEIKRKNREKEAKEQERLEDEKARNAVWDS